MKWCIFSVSTYLKSVFDQVNNSLCFSVPGLGPGDSDSLVLHLRGGARGAVRHPGGEKPRVWRQLRRGDRAHLEHRGGGEAGRDTVPAAAAARGPGPGRDRHRAGAGGAGARAGEAQDQQGESNEILKNKNILSVKCC